MRPVSGRLLLVTAACLAAVTWGLLHSQAPRAAALLFPSP
jgi:hypothetical protein